MYLLLCMKNRDWKASSFGVLLSAKSVMPSTLPLAFVTINMTRLSQSQYWIKLSGVFTPLVVSSASVARLHGDFTSVYILKHFQIFCIFCQPLNPYTSDKYWWNFCRMKYTFSFALVLLTWVQIPNYSAILCSYLLQRQRIQFRSSVSFIDTSVYIYCIWK